MNRIQELQLELMSLASFNDFEGPRVVEDLKEHQDLWRGAVLDRDGLIKLRDIERGYWNVDTLYLLPALGKEYELEGIANLWGADEVDWIGGDTACYLLGSYSPEKRSQAKQILRVWWD